MPDFDTINKSLKVACVERIFSPIWAMWKSLPLDCLRP